MTTALLFSMMLTASDTGSLTARLVHADGTPRSEAGVVVFLADATGAPIRREPGEGWDNPRLMFLPSFYMLSIGSYVSAITNEQGAVQFDDLPSGDYRLVAQKWDGVLGHPKHPKGYGSSNRWRLIPNTVTAYGVATASVSDELLESVNLPPVGEGEVVVDIKREHRGNLLVVSLGEPIVVPEVAGTLLNRHLDKDVVLVQHVSQTSEDIVLRGLPTDRDVTIAVMAYDNSPGYGGIIARAELPTAGRRPTRYPLEVFASWSDARLLPEPDRLKPLLAFLANREQPVDLISTLSLGDRKKFEYERPAGRVNEMLVWHEAVKQARGRVDLTGFGDVLIGDLLMAKSFLDQRARRAIQARKEEQLREQSATSPDE